MMLNKEKREELMGILLQARSAEEAAALLKEVGVDAPSIT